MTLSWKAWRLPWEFNVINVITAKYHMKFRSYRRFHISSEETLSVLGPHKFFFCGWKNIGLCLLDPEINIYESIKTSWGQITRKRKLISLSHTGFRQSQLT